MLLSILSVKLKDLSAAIWKSMRLKLKSLRIINQCVLISIFLGVNSCSVKAFWIIFFGCKFEKKFKIFDFFGQTLETTNLERRRRGSPAFHLVHRH